MENINFSFEDYITSLDDNQTREFVKKFGHGINETIRYKDNVISRTDFVKENPKLAIWITIEEIVACFYLEKELEQYKEALTFTISPEK